jgi:AcrR family transcriptional regulator
MPRSTDTPMNTKSRIVAAAIALFNDRGTEAVTTNHIAAKAGISPGNLYYHFRNKPDIIRAIFNEMDQYGVAEYRRISAERGPATADAVAGTFVMLQEFNWRYRFFKREMTSLVKTDPVLKKRFIKTHRAMLALVRNALDVSIAQGVLRDIPARERELLAEEIWLVTLFWPNYLELGGETVNTGTLERGTEQLRGIMLRYVTQKGLRAFSRPGRAG